MSVLEALGITSEELIARAIEDIKAEVQSDISDALKSEIKQVVQSSVKDVVVEQIKVAVNDVLNGQFQPIDQWGEAKGEPTTLRELTKKHALNYLSEKVNDKGETGYGANTTRVSYLAKDAAKSAMDGEVKRVLTDAVEQQKSELKKRVAEHITNIILAR